jgi:predicted nucleotidyltransferase
MSEQQLLSQPQGTGEPQAVYGPGATARDTPDVPAVSAVELAEYRATARRRWQQEQQEVARRKARAWEAARRAATLLKREFGATRVAAFGSLAREGGFTRWSDVDIAAWGIVPEDTFRAISAVMSIDSDIEVILVVVATCRPAVLASIEREGVEL